MKHTIFLTIFLLISLSIFAQQPVAVGGGSYASYTPLGESRSSLHSGCQAYQTEHRTIYALDSLLSRPLPSNDWWTYALVNTWTGKLWAYPTLVWADATGVSVALPTYWESTGCEMKWDNQVLLSAYRIDASGTRAPFSPQEALLSDWSDYHIAFVLRDGDSEIRTTVMHGSPIVWLEYTNAEPIITNPDTTRYAVFLHTSGLDATVAVAVLTEGLTRQDLAPYAYRIPRKTQIDYTYHAAEATLTTTFHIDYSDVVPTTANGVLQGFLPHHYYNTTSDLSWQTPTYQTPRGTLRLAQGNDFAITYPVHGMLPFFPLPADTLSGYSADRLRSLCADYAAGGSFGADTYWGGKGLTQMMHYMTAAYQLGDTVTFELAKSRLKATLIDWYTYTPGETQYYFARYPRWGALVGFDPSYDSDMFNDHHFHYGYFVYASAVLCLFDDDFRQQYGPMAREVAKDYANYDRTDTRYPLFRTLDPYCGHSFAGGLGNSGNGNGQESSSEAMQSWGGVWMLGAALGDKDLLEAGIFGYTLEARATAEYWFDRNRRNIDFTKYQHPYCCNLTMQGVGWWTWFSGDPVWMHSIQWLPISPVLQNYLSEDLAFARYDYTEMYRNKEVGDYEATSGGLGDESGLGNVCLSYLALFDPDSAARVWDRMDTMGKAIAKNTDTGGITYMLAHSQRQYGPQNHAIRADYPLAVAYTDTITHRTTYMVYNAEDHEVTVRFTDGKQWTAPAGRLSIFTDVPVLTRLEITGEKVVQPSSANTYTLHFYDQYGATYRTDSMLNYTAPAAAQLDTIRAGYQGLNAVLPIRVGALPYLAETTITPVMQYMSLGDSVDFSIAGKDQYGDTYPVDWTYHLAPTTPGQYTIQYTGTPTASQVVTVLPPYPNLALHKTATVSSEENAGTLAQYATDGDRTTRWGSKHKDGEYITIDLGQQCYIDYVTIRWEAAYASRFSLTLTDTQPATLDTSVVYRGTGGVQTIAMTQNGRYLTLCGMSRATAYGTSLYEIEAYGIPLAGDESGLFGLAIYADKSYTTQDEPIQFSVRGYNMQGTEIACTPTLTSTGGTISGSTLTPDTIGDMTLTATVGNIMATRTFTVMETERITATQVSPKTVTLPLGDTQTFTVQAVNQFGNTEMTSTELYEATSLGTYDLVVSLGGFTDTAHITVVGYADLNLALGKTATCSGSEGDGTNASKAVDGLLDSRWSSRFQDNEWICIDLGADYDLSRVKLYWESAYATSYEIQTSTDGVTFSTVYANTQSTGGTQDITLPADSHGRYVRVLCLTRNTGYGSSLWEIEVYGIGRFSTDIRNAVDNANNGILLYRNGHIYVLMPDGRCFSLSGAQVDNRVQQN